MFYFSKKVRLFSQNDVLFLFYFLINPTMTTAVGLCVYYGNPVKFVTQYLTNVGHILMKFQQQSIINHLSTLK